MSQSCDDRRSPVPPDLPRVLLVDDEPALLDGLRRQLDRTFNIATAVGGHEALRVMERSEPFAVVLSDMRMPGLSGAAFLTTVRERFPDTVRMLLTGQSDMEATIAAINGGQIYRFLAKPCPITVLRAALHDAADMHRQASAERTALNALRTAFQDLEGPPAPTPGYSLAKSGPVSDDDAESVALKPGTLGYRLAAVRGVTEAAHGRR